MIRPWTAADRAGVMPTILHCLSENAEAGADVAPTLANAALWWDQGLRWAEAGDPTLCDDTDGAIRAWTCWGGLATPWELRGKTCFGLATWVHPRDRREGLASVLRASALARARAQGYQRVVGTAFHAAGLASSLKAGFHAVGTQVECRL